MTRASLRGLVAGLVLSLHALAPPASAGARVEEVLVTHAGTDDAVVDLASGVRLWLDLRQDCLVLRGCVGWTILLWSPDPYISTRSLLLLPEWDGTCPIWQVDTLPLAKSAKQILPEVPVEGLRAMRQALEWLGYDCGPAAQQGWTPEAGLAFQRFRESKRLETSPQGMRRAVTSLALDVMRGRQATGTSQRLARTISGQLDALVSCLSRPGSPGARCGATTGLRSVDEDGALVTLTDGTRWQPAAELRAQVARWQDGDDLLACSGRLINVRTGEMARATRLE
jgi:hypothetical protein